MGDSEAWVPLFNQSRFADLSNWYTIVLAVPYFMGALREESFKGEVSLARGAWLLWALAIHPVVWRDHPGQRFLELVKFLRIG